jgi:hypothetical protein
MIEGFETALLSAKKKPEAKEPLGLKVKEMLKKAI